MFSAVLEFLKDSRLSAPCSRLLACVVLALPGTSALAGDSVVVFNEVMYHPAVNEPAMEWVELHNQMAVNVDLSGWSIGGGIDYVFPEGTTIPGKGYLVVAISPAALAQTAGVTNALGPFIGRLSNSGERLELRNKNLRLMDSLSYGVDNDWPVGPDGSGVSLCKRDEAEATASEANWVMSEWTGGTPGRLNFAQQSYEVTNTVPLTINGSWQYRATGEDLGSAWKETAYPDETWQTGAALFKAGNVNPGTGGPEAIPTLFSTGMSPEGSVLPPGVADPHYQLTLSAQSVPPPPAIAATVIQNHPAWLANDLLSSWLGPVNPGLTDVAAGDYNYRTTFSLDGFNPAGAQITFYIGADNRLNDVLLNGVSKGISFAGFSSLSGAFTINSGFISGNNTLDFLTANDGTGANPAGFRARISGTAQRQIASLTDLPAGRTNYYFRSNFVLGGRPELASLKLKTIVADGAVFYLNGTEVLRVNMPQGPVTASTLAVSNVPSPAYLGPFFLPGTALQSGANVLAVELHPALAGLNDVLFGADLALTQTNLLRPPPTTLALNEIASGTNADFWLELHNYGSGSVDLDGLSLVLNGTISQGTFTFPPQNVAPGQAAQFSASTLGFTPAPGDQLFLYGQGGSNVLDAVTVRLEPRGRWPDGTGRWGFPTLPTPGETNLFEFHRDIVINEILYHAPKLPPAPGGFATVQVLTITNAWKYHNFGVNLGSTWRTNTYDDSAWPIGNAVFYNTSSVLPADKNTELSLNTSNGVPIVTWYFRTPFSFSGVTNSAELQLQPILDDGAVYYLNGVEIYRQNMAAGQITYTNFSSVGVATPVYSGPFTVAVTNLLPGANLLAVEVHQFTTNPIAADMAFGLDLSVIGEVIPPLPARESPESWVELYNRGTNAADLTGWRLDEGIDFRFAPDTVIPPGGYLVVAKDPEFVNTNYPGIQVVGPFTNSLSRRGDYVVLKDQANNIADEVRYFDAGNWPEYADGGGASLELRDPYADNDRAEAWGASNESGRSGWNTYTYRGTAQNLLGPTLWNELQIGLLDAGECLIDDLRVTESPRTAPVELLQDGAFEGTLSAWRRLGNHSASKIIEDPDKPGNHVLHLVASGATYHLHNHLETTYAGGRSVVDGREYEISFRAKWLAGNNRLNTRLYFNRVARTTALPMPARHGTPGTANSIRVPNLGPTFIHLQHAPVVPAPADPIVITVGAWDFHGLDTVRTWWTTNLSSWTAAVMQLAGNAAEPGYRTYTATLPGFPAGTLVQFYIEATDSQGASANFPALGRNSRALIRVDEGKALMSRLHRLRLWMTPADTALLHAPTNVMSDDRLRLTIVSDEQKVYYDAGIHLQSSQRGRNDSSRVGFNLRFLPDRLYRGVQNTITIDRSGGYSGRGGKHDEILLWHAVNHAAGGLLGLDCDLVQVFAPRASEDGTGMLRMAAFDSEYFKHQYDDSGDGAKYRLELIYYPLTTLTGNPQAPKLPNPDEVINVDFQNWGDDPENYRWIFLQENNADVDDYSRAVRLNKAFSQTGTQMDAQLAPVMDEDQWLRTLAFKAFTGDADTYTAGLNHNWKFYFRASDGRSVGLLWDMDFDFTRALNDPFPGSSSPNTTRFVNRPNNLRRYYNHLLDILTSTVNAAHLQPWADHYAGLLGQNWDSAVAYLQQRADFIRAAMPLATAFAITSNGGNNFGVSNSPVTLSGTAPMTVKTIQVNGIARPVTWGSLTSWTVSVPLGGYTNLLVFQGVDAAGNLIPAAVDSITITNFGAPAPRPVVINEWMADNAAPAGFTDSLDGRYQDWFELYNPNAFSVNLSGYYLSDTLSTPTLWQIPTNTVIGPKSFLLVWADRDLAQNGLGPDLHADFQLSRTGDSLGLYSPDLVPQHTLSFGLQSQNVSQGLYPDGDTNSVQAMPNWTPRAPNQTGAPPSPELGIISLQPGSTVSFEVAVIPGRAYQVYYTENVGAPTWLPLGSTRHAVGPTLPITDTLNPNSQRFYRVILLQ